MATAGARHALLGLAAAAALAGGGCSADDTPAHLQIVGGDAARGRVLTQNLGCGACHTIPRIPGAIGKVGPPLTDFAQRTILAGHQPNVPRTLIPFLIDPPAQRPGTAMPSLGLDASSAGHIATFLYTLGAAGSTVAVADHALDSEESRRGTAAPLAVGAGRP